MTFQVALPFSGPAGWAYLSRTEATQREAIAASPTRAREAEYFAETFPKITSSGALFEDRRLLSFALTAFGLEEDLQNTAFMRAVVREGIDDNESLANRLADKRYLDFAIAFSDDSFRKIQSEKTEFVEKTISRYMDLQYETSVGLSDSDLRVSMIAQRELSDLFETETTDETKIFRVLGSTALRSVFEAAFNLPQEFSAISIDSQAQTLDSVVRDRFGEDGISALSDPENAEELIQLYLLKSSIQDLQIETTSSKIALQILQGS